MFQLDEKLFADIERECCWFTLPMFDNLPNIDSEADITPDDPLWNNDACVQRHIFAMIFGGHGYSVNLSTAMVLATIKLGQIEKRAPERKSPDNPEFIKWLALVAQYNILLGTVFAYLHDYPIASALLMNGLKTRAINLFMPYCDFINYVLSRVAEMPSELIEHDGCGFSVDEPMGSTELNHGVLNARAAEMIISALKGDNREIVLSYFGVQKYGSLKRIGSTTSDNFRNCIDIYEVLILDRRFNLKKVRFYFNGYFTPKNGYEIRLPKGFHLDPLSEAAQIFKSVD